jgi:uncharacterized protein (TIGR00303 family)
MVGVRIVGSWSPREWLDTRVVELVIFIASTRVSTIPGISAAGPSPEGTLYTPALDTEYLVLGRPRSADAIPVTPDGIPTPAIITRAVLGLTGLRVMVADVGSYVRPRIPVVVVPGGVTGGRVDVEDALPRGRARELFENSATLGRMLGSPGVLLVVGESMPGGTTTAMATMEALGFRAAGRVSSSSPRNPHDIKVRVLRQALERSSLKPPVGDVFTAIDALGDPLHVSIAGFVAGALERGSRVLLAGGTQMAAVLAILKRLGLELGGRVAIGTTRWVVEDRSSDLVGLVAEIAPEVPVLYSTTSFGDSPFRGLRAYEEGYVKEGVGAGGCLVAGSLIYGLGLEEIKRAIYEEYSRVLDLAEKSRSRG